MNCAIIIRRVKGQDGKSVRKAISIQEINSADSYHSAFQWDPKSDFFNAQLEDSVMLSRIAEQTGRNMDEILDEYEKRKIVLKWLLQRGIRSYSKVGETIGKYYRDPEAMINKIEYGG